MKDRAYSWTIYSIGLFVVWAIILLLSWKLKDAAHLRAISLVFFGYFIGWLSATIKHVLIAEHIKSK